MSQAAPRPLSPHLQIYRPQLTSILSISHRFTGLCLSLGSVVLAWWVIAAAAGEDAFAIINGLLGAWYGLVLMILWTYALFYHLCNGIRHLGWDAGWGLELDRSYLTGYLVIAVAAVLTVIVWAVALV
ncbi:MAG: succinate dehydrogenase, cytochrome b556 subunit [Salinisphaera sp.]|nr:succinate dehydrogenase, cytochrome b556 subunit [Salinisphaera sp.]